jgi:hypothetical protein
MGKGEMGKRAGKPPSLPRELRTPLVSIPFDLCNQDTSQLRTAVVSPKGVLNREVRLFYLK